MSMRSAIMGSTSVHLALLAALFIVRHASPLVVPGPDVVQVALLDPTLTPAVVTPTPPTPPQPERKEPEIAPADAEGVKLQHPKPPPKKHDEPKPDVPPPPAPMPSLPYASAGSPGLSAGMAVDARDFEFTYYLVQVRNLIAQNWSPPTGLAGGGAQVRAVVYFKIARDGSVSSVRLESGSQVEFFDQSAVRAVTTLGHPLPPLPLGFSGGDLGVHFGFQYGGP